MIKLIIFDYDGVIVDSFPIYHKIYRTICDLTDKKWPGDIDTFRKIYGKNSHECWNNLELTDEEKIIASKTIKEELPKYEPRAFEDIDKVLGNLRHKFQLAVVSSSPIEEVKRNLNKYDLMKYFDAVIAKEHDKINRFTKTEHIRKLIADKGLKLDEVLLVGDRNVDFIEGHSAGLKNIILVDYGWGYNKKEIPEYESKFLINKPADLLQLLD